MYVHLFLTNTLYLFFKRLVFMKKKILIAFLIAILLGAFAVWYFIFYGPTHNRRNPANEEGIAITATNLINEFTLHEDSANKKYNNKVIEVTGVVKEVNIDSIGTTVLLTADKPNTGVSGRLKEAVKNISVGSTITIKGLFTGFILGEVQLNEAAVTSNHTPAVVAKPDTAKVSTVEVKKDSVIEAPVSKTFTTKTANIKFFTKSPAEDIDAVNNQVTATLDNGTGDINFVALIKGFRFDNELMQEHFNGKEFLQSDVYPRAEFEGVITNLKAVNFSVDGKYSVKTEGTLKLHGVSKKLTTNGTITINHGKVSSQSVFTISFSDFNIKSFDDDAKDVVITVNAKYN